MVIYKAWKKPIYEGSIPVDPGGTMTSQVEMAPALAVAFLLFPRIIDFKSKTDLFEKIIPNFPTNKGLRFLSYSMGSPNLLKKSKSSISLSRGAVLQSKAFLITVFLPMTK